MNPLLPPLHQLPAFRTLFHQRCEKLITKNSCEHALLSSSALTDFFFPTPTSQFSDQYSAEVKEVFAKSFAVLLAFFLSSVYWRSHTDPKF
jgi:hypothetical protein